MPHYPKEIEYSQKYTDKYYEYRHVLLPKDIYKQLPKRLLTEEEWRKIGVNQSKGWKHYMIHKPEPFVLLFRRPLGTDPETGIAPLDKVFLIEEYEKKRQLLLLNDEL